MQITTQIHRYCYWRFCCNAELQLHRFSTFVPFKTNWPFYRQKCDDISGTHESSDFSNIVDNFHFFLSSHVFQKWKFHLKMYRFFRNLKISNFAVKLNSTLTLVSELFRWPSSSSSSPYSMACGGTLGSGRLTARLQRYRSGSGLMTSYGCGNRSPPKLPSMADVGGTFS